MVYRKLGRLSTSIMILTPAMPWRNCLSDKDVHLYNSYHFISYSLSNGIKLSNSLEILPPSACRAFLMNCPTFLIPEKCTWSDCLDQNSCESTGAYEAVCRHRPLKYANIIICRLHIKSSCWKCRLSAPVIPIQPRCFPVAFSRKAWEKGTNRDKCGPDRFPLQRRFCGLKKCFLSEQCELGIELRRLALDSTPQMCI